MLKMVNFLFKWGKRIVPKSFKKHVAPVYQSVNKLLRYGRLDFFTSIEVETLTRCNRKCHYCPNSKFDRGDHYMSTELYKKIVDELASVRYNGRISPHFYGEPLLDGRLAGLIEYTRRKLPDSYIVIYTNGDYLTSEKFFELIRKGVDYFLVTQHIGVISDVLKKTLGALGKEDRKKIVLKVFDKETEFLNRGGLVEVEKKNVMESCDFPASGVVIDYQGNVVLCCNDYFSTVKFGNLKTEKLLDIWKKPGYTRLRKELSKGKFRLEICKKCANLV